MSREEVEVEGGEDCGSVDKGVRMGFTDVGWVVYGSFYFVFFDVLDTARRTAKLRIKHMAIFLLIVCDIRIGYNIIIWLVNNVSQCTIH